LLTTVTFDLWNTLLENVDYGGFRERVLQGVLSKYGVSLIGDDLTRAYLAAIEYNKRAWKEENFRAVPTIESINYMIWSWKQRIEIS
jgi:hypothetical protein